MRVASTRASSGNTADTGTAPGSGPRFDLLLAGGRVIDPDSGRDGRFDVAFADGNVAAIEPHIDERTAREVIPVDDAIVVPGLVDPHVHACYGIGDSVRPDDAGIIRGATTVVDGGTCGVGNFGALGPVIDASSTRVFAWLNISSIGQTDNQLGECLMLPLLRVEEAVDVAKANPDTIVGFKARLSTYASGGADLTVLSLLLEAGEAAGLPVMVHVGDTQHPLADILRRMRPGDWVSHFLTPRKHGILGLNYVPGATLIPEAIDAQRRGVIMDSARGRNHIGFPQLQAWLDAGLLPDTISSDLTIPGSSDPDVSLLQITSSMMAFGARFEDLLPTITINPARALRRDGTGIGKLQVNGIGDATVLRIVKGEFIFRDVNGWPKKGDQRVEAAAVVRSGAYTALIPPAME